MARISSRPCCLTRPLGAAGDRADGVAEPADNRAGATRLLGARDPERDCSAALLGGGSQAHVLDVDAGATEGEGDLGHHPGPVLDPEAQLEQLAARGAIFVEEETEVPEGEIVVFSAHGVAPAVHERAAERKLRTIDATCPLVTKDHVEARKFAEEGYTTFPTYDAGA